MVVILNIIHRNSKHVFQSLYLQKQNPFHKINQNSKIMQLLLNKYLGFVF